MEVILKSGNEQNLAKLFALKNIAYNQTLKEYVHLFNQLQNIPFENKLNRMLDYKIQDLTTVVIEKNIDCNMLQENIMVTYDFLKMMDGYISSNLDYLSETFAFCNDYKMLSNTERMIVNECYVYARYIQIICSTDFYKTFKDNYMHTYELLEKKIKIGYLRLLKNKLSEIFC